MEASGSTKLGAKCRFKDLWDAFGKPMKWAMLRLELQEITVPHPNAHKCHSNNRKEIGEEDISEEMKKLLECKERATPESLATQHSSQGTLTLAVALKTLKNVIGQFLRTEVTSCLQMQTRCLKWSPSNRLCNLAKWNQQRKPQKTMTGNFDRFFLSCSCDRCQEEGSSMNGSFQALRNVKAKCERTRSERKKWQKRKWKWLLSWWSTWIKDSCRCAIERRPVEQGCCC